MSDIGFKILQWKRKKVDRWSKCSISFIINIGDGDVAGLSYCFLYFCVCLRIFMRLLHKRILRNTAHQYRYGSIDGTVNFHERKYCWSQMLGSLLGLKKTTSSIFQKPFYPSFSKEGSNINLHTFLECGIYINKMHFLMLA